MSKNYMAEVAQMLGLEIGEVLNAPEYNLYGLRFTEKGIVGKEGCVYASLLQEVLEGNYEIKKLPWKPKRPDKYYAVTPKGYIDTCMFFGDKVDLALYAFGNCFRTEADAIKHRDEILAKFEKIKGELGIE